MSKPSKTIPPTAPAWSPDQPLRADATDAQILVRTQWHWDNNKLISMKKAQVLVAREFAAAVAASGSPPSPTPLNAKDKQDAERWRMFISKAHAGVTEDGDIWCGFSGGEPDDYTDVLTLKQVETLNNDDPSPRMAKDIVRRLIDDLVGARASSGSTGAPPLDQPTPAAEIDELCEAVAALAQPAGPTEDTLRLDALHREGHSLMVYGNGLWDAGWGVMPTPRDAIDAMRRDYCNVIMRESEEGVDRCKRPAGHTGEHWTFPDDLPPLPAVASVRSAPAPE